MEGIKTYTIPDGCVIARNTKGYLDLCPCCNIYFRVRMYKEFKCRECGAYVCEECAEECENLDVVRHSFYYSKHFIYCNDTCRAKNVVKLKKQKTLLKRLS